MRNITIKVSLTVTLLVVAIVLALSIATGWITFRQADAGFRTLYEDRVVPLRDLKVVADMYAVNIVDASHKARNGNFTWSEAVAGVEEAQTRLAAAWKSYAATYLVPDEQKLVESARPLMAKAGELADRLRDILKREDKAALDTLVREQLYQVIDPISAVISDLVELQLAVAKEEAQKFDSAAQTAAIIFAAAASLGALAIGAAFFATYRGVLGPLRRTTEMMTRLAAGDLAVEVPADERRTEIGEMNRALRLFKSNGLENIQLQQAAEESRRREAEAAQSEAERQRLQEERDRSDAEKRRRQAEEARLAEERRQREAEEAERASEAERLRLAAERQERLNQIFAGFERSVGRVAETVAAAAGGMQDLARSMAASVGATGERATAAAAASEQASSNVQMVAAAAEELAASVHEIGRQVQTSSGVAGQAVQEADRTNHQMEALAQSAERIGRIVSLITDIAGKTNLLALNATIEAARAGEAGKGFAVVASEVKTLANQTAKATDEIGAQVAAIQTATKDAVASIRGIGSTIGQVNEIATAIAAAVDEQGSATREIARNVQQAAQGTQEVSNNVAGVTAVAGETGQAADQVLAAAADLAAQAESLKTEVASFIDQVRAA